MSVQGVKEESWRIIIVERPDFLPTADYFKKVVVQLSKKATNRHNNNRIFQRNFFEIKLF